MLLHIPCSTSLRFKTIKKSFYGEFTYVKISKVTKKDETVNYYEFPVQSFFIGACQKDSHDSSALKLFEIKTNRNLIGILSV